METNGNKNEHSSDGYRYVFGDIEVDPTNRLLLRDGVEIPITGKVFDVLLVLIGNPGRLLGKSEMLEQVWPDEFVEEGNLARNVSTLRKALGDTGKPHSYITTVPRRGYRFVAEVERITTLNGSGLQVEDNGTGLHGVLFSRFWLLLLTAVVFVGSGLIFLQGGFSPTKANAGIALENIRQRKLTQDGNVYMPAISRDGQYLAYIAISEKAHGIRIRQISTGSTIEIVPPEPGSTRWGVTIAPDNESVYYLSRDNNGDLGYLYSVSLFGGTPRRLAEGVRGYSVSPDSRRLALVRCDKQAAATSLVVTDIDGSNQTAILASELDTIYYAIDWSPDGHDLLYSIRRLVGDELSWYVAQISATGGEERRINKPIDAGILAIKWLPDKSGFIAVAKDAETRRTQLHYLSYPEGEFRRITSDVDGQGGFTITGDGRTLVTGRAEDDRHIWVMPGGRNDGVEPIVGGTQKHFDSVVWQGNEYLIFDEDENSSYDNRNIWRIRRDGAERLQLTSGTGNNRQPTVSPDGQTIVFISGRGGRRQLWRMNAEGHEQSLLIDLGADVTNPRFSNDGQTIFFNAWVDGKNQIWRTTLDGDKAVAVIDADVHHWAVAPDGMKISYSFFDQKTKRVEGRVYNVNAATSDIYPAMIPETWMQWAPDGRAIYFSAGSDGARNVWRQDLDGSPPQQVTDLSGERIFDCKWSPDGEQLACVRQSITFDAVLILFGH